MDLTDERRNNIRNNIRSQISRARHYGCDATLTMEEWLIILDRHEWKCAYCQINPYQDIEHLIPVKDGGGTTASNCVPSCRSCNRKKGLREGRLDEQGTVIIIPRAIKPIKQETDRIQGIEKFLTVKDLSKILQVSEYKIWRWRDNEGLPDVWISYKCVRFRRSEVEQWIESRPDIFRSA